MALNKSDVMDFSNRDALYDENIYHEVDITAEQEQSVRKYFETGDIEQYIADEKYIEPVIAIFFAPQHTLEHFKFRIQTYWDWLLNNQGHSSDKRKEKHLSMDGQFHRTMDNLYSIAGALFPPDFFEEVFTLTYGERFEAERLFPMSFGKDNWQPLMLQNDATPWCSELMLRIDSHIFGLHENHHVLTPGFKNTISYFASMLPHLNKECYSTKLFSQHHRTNGKPSNYLMYQYRVRGFLHHLEGFMDDDMVDAGFTKINVNDDDCLTELIDKIESTELPEEFHVLREFVKKHGDKDIYVSE